MKNPHAHAAFLLLAAALLLAAPPAPGRAARKPTNSREAAKKAVGDVSPRGAAQSSERGILVSIDSDRNVFLGKERVGTIKDTARLKKRVRRAVERNRRAASGEEEAEYPGAAFLCVPETLKYGEVVPVIDAIKEGGGDPIGLETRPGGCGPR
jgi:biopolymer transport protein ExbD